MSKLPALKKKNLPTPPPIKKLLGPSFILLGLGLGSGELILWPYLAANYGMGIIWGAVLGITFQFFLNMEIERYALVTGESVFVGLARKMRKLSPVWFIASTLIPWMWPGIIASCATLLAFILGIEYTPIIPISLLLIIGLGLTLGPVIYKTQEVFQRTLIIFGVPFIFLLTFFLAKPMDWQDLASGLVGSGKGYSFLPAGISLATFIGAFAYAGAGGNLNLAQSYYIKEKGYGMGKFSGRITSLLTGKKEKVALTGTTFPVNKKNLSTFALWWKRINVEHAIVFWATGALTMIILSLLAYTTIYPASGVATGIDFVIGQAVQISNNFIPQIGILFLLVATLMLFSTQFSVMDATSRIMSENLVLLSPKRFKVSKLPSYFYLFLWLQIFAGIIIFSLGFTEPLTLVIISAVLNAVTMFIYSGLILWLNNTSLHKKLRPNSIRKVFVFLAFLFYGSFSLLTVLQSFFGFEF